MRGLNYYVKLFLLVLITVIIVSGLLLGLYIVRYTNDVQNLAKQSLNSSANQKAQIFDANINNLHALSKSIADDVEILDYFKKVYAGDNDSEFYKDLKLNLEEECKTNPDLIENAFFAYKGVIMIDGVGGTTVGYDIEENHSKWYEYVTTHKVHHLGELKQSPTTKLPVMVSGFPILDENNQILAVFGLAINLNGFSNTIINNSESSHENTIVIDENGTVIAANETDLIYNYHVNEEQPELYHFIENHKEGITYYEKEGIEYIASVKSTKMGVTIIQSLPVSVYQNPISNAILISIIILLFILVCVALVTNLIAKNITKPIAILVNELDEMASGNYENKIPQYLKTRKDEFGKLGNALDTMKRQTNQLIKNLNYFNEEVEASLEEVMVTREELRRQNDLLLESETKLKDSYEYNHAIISVLPDLIFVLDEKGTFTGCQASNENALLYPKDTFIGKNLRDVLPGEVAEKGYEKIQKAINTDTLQTFEYALIINEEKNIYELRIVRSSSNSVVAIARNITDHKLYQQQIEYLSYHDQLTGLYNRRFFESELQRLDNESNLPLAILMADVNGLKLINDSFGHSTGDLLLSKFAEVLKKSCQPEAAICRIGGDEFVILIPSVSEEQIENLIKNIKEKCFKEKIEAINLSVSFGWDFKKKVEEDILGILKSAEDYMYKKKLFEGPSMRGETIGAIINTLHEKNKREEQHSHRVAQLCKKLATALHMSESEIEEIKSAGLMHDIGKIAIQENLLNKPGKLTDEEFEEIARHPEIGYRILCTVSDMAELAEYALSHHERWDGKGYPRNLAGDEIPLQARMIAIADSYDAMTSVRSYRLPVSETEAAKEILKHAGTQFDPDLARVFVKDVLGIG